MTAPITLTAAENRLFTDLPEGEVAEALRSRGLPSRRTETWRWSDLRAALRDEKEVSGPYAGPDPAPIFGLPGAVTITCRNGAWDVPDLPDGTRVSLDAPRPAVLPGAELGSLATTAGVLTVEVDGAFRAPLIVRRLSDGQGTHADRLDLRVAPHGRAVLVETQEATGAPFVNSLTEIGVGEGARLTRIVAQPAADDALLVHTTLGVLSEGARFEQTAVTLGAALARHETRLRQGADSRARLDALYELGGRRHNDTTAHVEFTGEGAETRQLVKGVAAGRSRGVFQGKFHVARAAQHTDAKMAHHALILEQGAQVNAKPELEIYADDVECAHGNTVGALDADHLFYLSQRGLSEVAARAVLVEAFVGEVLDRVGDEGVRAQLAALFGAVR
jgi:Fe-S cluster assembly protein SufD